jgi:hypothetical protein
MLLFIVLCVGMYIRCELSFLISKNCHRGVCGSGSGWALKNHHILSVQTNTMISTCLGACAQGSAMFTLVLINIHEIVCASKRVCVCECVTGGRVFPSYPVLATKAIL